MQKKIITSNLNEEVIITIYEATVCLIHRVKGGVGQKVIILNIREAIEVRDFITEWLKGE